MINHNNIIDGFIKIVGIENVRQNELMTKHTTFKIGGAAKFFISPRTIPELKEIIKICTAKNIPYYVIGNGSNVLVSDNGYNGAILHLCDKFNNISFKELKDSYIVTAEAGVLLSRLGSELLKRSCAGFEFAAGIPGTAGGAVMMNAGAYGGEIKDILNSVTVMDQEGEISVLKNENLQLGYRSSIISKKNLIVLEAVFQLQKGNKEEIQKRLKELAEKRREKQPLEFPSAGSTFKRPENNYAGKLISDAGLKGYQVGGAKVSEKHAGFVINTGNATAKDVIQLTDHIRKEIKLLYNIDLELEIKKIGFDK